MSRPRGCIAVLGSVGVLSLLGAIAPAAGAGELAATERRVERAVEIARASIVTVFSEKRGGWDLTGVVVGGRDVVLTLRKPLLDKGGGFRKDLRVRFSDSGKTVPAELIADDEETDTVLLRAVGGRGKPIKARPVGDASLGMWVLLVGNTFFSGRESEPVASLGIVSGIRDAGATGVTDVRAFHTSTLVNPGSFGAPVVDLSGGLLGILAAKVTGAGGQSVVVPYERIRDRYAGKAKAGRILGTRPYPRPKASGVAELFGEVMNAAAARVVASVVGVRCGEALSTPPADSAGAEKRAGGTSAEKGAGEKPGDKTGPPERTRRKGPPQRARVPGVRDAYDRGSGVVVAPDLVVCPLRVTGWPGPRRNMFVDLADGTLRTATVLGTDERLRIALLKVRGGGLVPIAMPKRSAGIEPGRFVGALGYPHEHPGGKHPHLTFGIVSRVGALASVHPAIRAIQTDAGVSGGNRGGALFDVEGRVLGVIMDVNDTNRPGYTRPMLRGAYGPNAGLGFAIPLDVVRSVLPRLEAGAQLKPGRLGVALAAEPGGGLRVRTVDKDSGAGKAGVTVDDVIVKLAGKEVADLAALRRKLAMLAAGDKIEVTVRRKGRELTLVVELK